LVEDRKAQPGENNSRIDEEFIHYPNQDPQRSSGVSLEAGNWRKSPPTLSDFASCRCLLCLYFHSNY